MYFKIDNTHWLHTYSSTKVRRFSRACVGAGELTNKGVIGINKNLDDFLEEGKYLISSGHTLFPIGGMMTVTIYKDYIHQTVFDILCDTFKCRVKSATTGWKPWKQIKLT